MRALPLLLFVVATLPCFAQNIDSLRKASKEGRSDSLRSDALSWLCYELLVDDAAGALPYGMEALRLASRLKSSYLLSRAHERIAECYAELKQFPPAHDHYGKAIQFTRAIKDTLFLGKAVNNLATCYLYEGKLDSSLLTHLQALQIRRSFGDQKQIAQSLNNIGMIYRMKKDYRNAISFYRESLQIKTALGDEKGVLNTSVNIGNAWKALKQYDSALYSYRFALQLSEKRKSASDIIDCKINMGLLYNAKGMYDEGLRYFNMVSGDLLVKQSTNYPILLTGLGESWLGKKEYRKAISFLQEALLYPSPHNRYEVPAELHLGLSEAYKGLGDYRRALDHFESFKSLSDSLLNTTNLENINELSARYESKQKENQIALLNTQNAIKDLSLESKQREILLYIIGLAAAISLAIALLYLFRNKQRTSKQLEEKNRIISASLSEKEVLLKEIHHRVKNNLQVVSSLLNLQSRNIRDAQALEAINEGKNRVKSMALIHQNLYRDDNLTGVDIRDYIDKLVSSLFNSYNITPDKIELLTEIDSMELDVDTVIPLGLILNELISNSLKYAFPENRTGYIKVVLKETGEGLLLAVEDNGRGLPADWQPETSHSLGYQLIRSFAQKLKARLEVKGNGGTSVSMVMSKYKKLTTV